MHSRRNMKYLDERIIATLNGLTIAQDGLYRYDVAINNEWESPAFIGNCFITKGATSKTIDITDIVRNFYDFSYPYEDIDFQAEWQVKIYTDETNTVLSDSIGIFPIYRYPNRKAALETPLSNNEVNWVQPALQGFSSEHKGEFLPHIPFVYSDKADYNIALNCGQVTNTPYLYSGVKKDLQLNNYGIYNTQYKLKELWTGDEVETLAWDFNNLTAERSGEAFTINIASLAPLTYNCIMPVTPKQIRYSADTEMYSVQQIEEFPFVADIQGDTLEGGVFDLYIEQEEDANFVDLYPQVNTSCTVKSHIFIDEALENDNTLITSGTGTDLTEQDDYWIIDTPGVSELTVTLRDENDAIIKTLTVSQGSNTFSILDTEGITQFEFVANGNNYDFNLDARCSAGAGAEYVFQFALETGTDIKIYPIVVKYDVDVTFRTYRQLNAPLDQDNIVIQNDGKDTLSSSDTIRFVQNKQNIEPISGKQTVTSTAAFISINSALNPTKKSYAVVDAKGILQNAGEFGAPLEYALKKDETILEGDFILYIFATENASYEVTKITTKDFGIAGIFSAFANMAPKIINLAGWNAVLNTSDEYQQYIASKNTFEVAKVDSCPSRYYLQWRDRYGSMQMQPFSKVDTYSEDFTRTEIKNYQDTRRLSNISIQPKWKLNTGWLNSSVYPYYESLFVSPWIKLYDVVENNIYDVIVTENSYTEKTFKNQSRSLFNLEINVEQTDKQNITY